MKVDTKLLVSQKDAGKIIGVGKARVSQLCRERKLETARVGRHILVVRSSAVRYRDDVDARKPGPKAGR